MTRQVFFRRYLDTFIFRPQYNSTVKKYYSTHSQHFRLLKETESSEYFSAEKNFTVRLM